MDQGKNIDAVNLVGRPSNLVKNYLGKKIPHTTGKR